jgi:hypothetical protein
VILNSRILNGAVNRTPARGELISTTVGIGATAWWHGVMLLESGA